MPQSRKRHGHHEHHQPSAIPAKQRTKGRTILAILFAVFAVVIAFFAAGNNYILLVIAALVGAAIGYVVGRSMEQDASHINGK
jgi:drug/metabolite transporter (DMT)-like permease